MPKIGRYEGKPMSATDKIAKAKPTTWVRDGFSDEEVKNIVSEEKRKLETFKECLKFIEDHKYEGEWPVPHSGNYIVVENPGMCCVCGKPTHAVEINYEEFVCSNECEAVLDKEYLDWLAKKPDIKF